MIDSSGVTRDAPLFFVAPSQINYQMPAGTSHGHATIAIMRAGKLVAEGSAQVSGVAPGIFAANSDGKGVPACNVLRVRANGSLIYEDGFRFDAAQGKLVPTPIDLGPESDIVFLVLYGTGFRFRDNKRPVGAGVGNLSTPVDYAGVAPGYEGVDQMNIRLPRALIGRGNVDVNLLIEGLKPNIVTVNIK